MQKGFRLFNLIRLSSAIEHIPVARKVKLHMFSDVWICCICLAILDPRLKSYFPVSGVLGEGFTEATPWDEPKGSHMPALT